MTGTPQPDFLIADILPSRTYHHLVGSTGTNKTTWLFQTLAYWMSGSPVLGHATAPVDWVYIALEHSLEETYRTAARVGVLDMLKPYLMSTIEDVVADSIVNIRAAVKRRFPNTKLLILDGVAALIEDGKISDYGAVKTFIRNLRTITKRDDLTILGVGLDAKPNGSTFVPYRQRPAGSHAWGQYSSTIFVLEREHPDQIKDVHRRLIVEPRNAAGEEHRFVLDTDGRLQNLGDQEADFFLDQQLETCPFGTVVLTRDIRRWGENEHLGHSAIERWITNCLQDNRLLRLEKGRFKVIWRRGTP